MSENSKPGVWEGFKSFLMRGNVIDLAVAVVIGAAFTNIVNAVVKGVINPVVGAFGTQDLDQYSYCLESPCVPAHGGEEAQGIQIMWGTVLSAALTFLITAAVVYFLMVLPMSRYLARLAARREAKYGTPEVPVSELDVLKDIRDELVAARIARGESAPNGPAAPGATAGPGQDGPGTPGGPAGGPQGPAGPTKG